MMSEHAKEFALIMTHIIALKANSFSRINEMLKRDASFESVKAEVKRVDELCDQAMLTHKAKYGKM